MWAKPGQRSLSSNLLLASLLLAALAGCQTGVGTRSPDVAADEPASVDAAPDRIPSPGATPPDAIDSTEPLATYRRAEPDGGIRASATARLTGVLALRDDCLVLDVEGGPPVQPVFPADEVRWDAASRQLAYAGRSYRLGDEVTVGGGGVESDRATGVDGPRCAGASLFVVS